jgi:undecaprenyl-diphosphatase
MERIDTTRNRINKKLNDNVSPATDTGGCTRCNHGASAFLSLTYIQSFIITSIPFWTLIFCLYFLLGSEEKIYLFFADFRPDHPRLTIFFTILTDWGNGLFYLIYSTILIRGIIKKDKTLLLLSLYYMVFQLLISFLVVRVLKITIGRPRPGMGHHFHPLSLQNKYNSLPSGHTAEIFGAIFPLSLAIGATATTAWRKKLFISLILGCYGMLLAFSRVYLGKHHPLDLLLGYLLGSLSGFLTFTFWQRKKRKHRKVIQYEHK